MWQGMKSVMVFHQNDSQTESNLRWEDWIKHKNSDGYKTAPTVEHTTEYLKSRKTEENDTPNISDCFPAPKKFDYSIVD
ncbi:hypothetical protein LG329_04690 [Virgibacillus necropolis]|uniref:hypothetical protein n=1 Tax=Virgibacillus necropolis TaxID=163877 RepID=UPI003851306E